MSKVHFSIIAILASIILVVLFLTAAAIGADQPQNLIKNSSFEEAVGNMPAEWKTQTWGGQAEFKYEQTGHTGNRCVMISSEAGADAGWQTIIAVKPFSQYKLSGWIKTENVVAKTGKGALLNLSIQPLQTRALTGSNDWMQVELLFDSGSNDSIEINCLFGGWGLATGKAFYDDLCLELLSTKTIIVNPAVKIDASKTSEPISKYIYGQFIEHLGRCIYGGIWAEMLEDRKFYYPITDKFDPWGTATDPFWNTGPYKYLNASPWQVIGPAGTVTMDKANPYVGEHTPVIQVPGNGTQVGIRQDGLAIVKGKDYTGRIILAGDKETLPITVQLVLDDGKVLTQEIDKISPDFQTYPLKFAASASSDNVKVEITSKGKGKFKIGTLSLMPADNIKGWRPDVVALLKELNSPIYRWPGGNFVSGYNWRDGVGEQDKRPPRKNPAWTGVEHDDVGIHEYMELMKLIGAEPYVSVNTGLGTVEEVADEVEYCNGSADTPMGKFRAKNGHPAPYGVKWWAVGNEMYGFWQKGYMPLEEYVKKHNRVAEAMRKVDKNIKLIGVGEAESRWSETMLKVCSNYMDLISEHIYCKEKTNVLAHSMQLSELIIRKADAHRKYRKEIKELAGKNIRIAMDEWNFWYGDYLYGQLGVRYHLKDALGVAIGLHEYFRNSDLYFMANYAQTVNVIGAIKTSGTAAAFETTGLVLKLYRNHFGQIPVAVSGEAFPLDVAAAWTENRETLTISIVNPTEQKCELAMDVKGTNLADKGWVWIITHSDPMAYNEPGKAPNVVIKEESVTGISNKLNVPPLSISIYEFKAVK